MWYAKKWICYFMLFVVIGFGVYCPLAYANEVDENETYYIDDDTTFGEATQQLAPEVYEEIPEEIRKDMDQRKIKRSSTLLSITYQGRDITLPVVVSAIGLIVIALYRKRRI